MLRPAQDSCQYAAEVGVADRFGGNGVDRTQQVRVDHGAQIDVQKVVQADPRGPLLAVAKPAAQSGFKKQAQQP
ncbi:MAG TPA: hypothetical protein VIC62_00120 [Nakamurella sp.]